VSKGKSPTIIQAPAPQNLAQEQAEANRITQFTPAGNLFFGQYDAPTQKFTPQSGSALRLDETSAQKAIRELEEIGAADLAATGATLAGQLPTSPLTTEGLTARPDFDLSGVRAIPGELDQGALEERYAGRALELLQPELERRERDLTQSFANRGLPYEFNPETGEYEGAKAALDLGEAFGREREGLLSALAFDAIRQGEQRQADIFGRDLARRGLERADVTDRIGYDVGRRQAELGERVGLRQQAQQELTGLLTGQMLQTPQLGAFVPPGQIDVLGPYAMQQQNSLQRAQIASQDRAARLNALGSIAGAGASGYGSYAALAGCDYRLKENIEPMPDGAVAKVLQLKPKHYNYRAESGLDTSPTEGFIAHEVQEVIPDAVIGNKDGALPQMIDMMSMLSTLTKAMQEISTRLVKLEQENN
jgi:hypothetical protein